MNDAAPASAPRGRSVDRPFLFAAAALLLLLVPVLKRWVPGVRWTR